MDQAAAWIAVGIGLVGLVFAYLTYKRGTGRRELSYVVTTNAALIPPPLGAELKLSHDGVDLQDPALAIVRIVSTGDLEIKQSDFETPLSVRFEGVARIASAICSASRPRDLRPELDVDRDVVRIRPRLINPGEMIELQVLSAGPADAVSVEGRIANLKLEPLSQLPYPPGMGPEGEFRGRFDYSMIWIVPQLLILGFGATIALGTEGYSTLTRTLILLSTLIVSLAWYLRTRYLVDRRALWRPPAGEEPG